MANNMNRRDFLAGVGGIVVAVTLPEVSRASQTNTHAEPLAECAYPWPYRKVIEKIEYRINANERKIIQSGWMEEWIDVETRGDYVPEPMYPTNEGSFAVCRKIAVCPAKIDGGLWRRSWVYEMDVVSHLKPHEIDDFTRSSMMAASSPSVPDGWIREWSHVYSGGDFGDRKMDLEAMVVKSKTPYRSILWVETLDRKVR